MGEERRDRVREENLRMIRMNGLMDVELIRRSAVQIRQDAKASLAQGLGRLTRNPIFPFYFYSFHNQFYFFPSYHSSFFVCLNKTYMSERVIKSKYTVSDFTKCRGDLFALPMFMIINLKNRGICINL